MQNLSIKMIRENLTGLPQCDLPNGFEIRRFMPGDEVVWVRINSAADIYNKIDMDLFRREFGYDQEGMKSRGYFLCVEGGEEVGTATAWYNNDYHGMRFGRLHWVAIVPEFQGRGLAKPMISMAMNRLAEEHDNAYLTTSTARPVALKIYLDFGFVPDIDSETDVERWRLVREYLKHPTLSEESLWHRW